MALSSARRRARAGPQRRFVRAGRRHGCIRRTRRPARSPTARPIPRRAHRAPIPCTGGPYDLGAGRDHHVVDAVALRPCGDRSVGLQFGSVANQCGSRVDEVRCVASVVQTIDHTTTSADRVRPRTSTGGVVQFEREGLPALPAPITATSKCSGSCRRSSISPRVPSDDAFRTARFGRLSPGITNP
jgi:hypothetical protein